MLPQSMPHGISDATVAQPRQNGDDVVFALGNFETVTEMSILIMYPIRHTSILLVEGNVIFKFRINTIRISNLSCKLDKNVTSRSNFEVLNLP